MTPGGPRPTPDRETVRARAGAFLKLHQGPAILVLPNPWDAGSAVLLARAGFPALATTSSGIAFSLGYADGEHMGREEMVRACGRIAARVDVPVSADLERGYGDTPGAVGETVRLAIGAGLVGANLEDGTKQPQAPLRDEGEMAGRIRAARQAAEGEGVPFVINARTDGYLIGGSGPAVFDDTVRRGNAYLAAGADCVFVPGRLDLETIGRLVEAIEGPVSLLGAFSGWAGHPVAELQKLGVARVTFGGSLALACLALVNGAAEELRDEGTFGFAKGAFGNTKMNKMLGD